ncbi:MAG: nucleotide exchange factor GrpE [Candidatus Babeliales bacterium]|jgi:molecular chaperone GrpE
MANHDENNNKETTQQDTTSSSTTAQQPEQMNYKELYLRTTADLQNFRRRTERERAEWAQLIQADVIEKILPILDDVDRAVQTTQLLDTAEAKTQAEGLELIAKNFRKILNSLGVEEIAATGEFNPELQEAIMQVSSPDHTSGSIVQELRKGYTLKGKVLRHAQVSVAS